MHFTPKLDSSQGSNHKCLWIAPDASPTPSHYEFFGNPPKGLKIPVFYGDRYNDLYVSP